MASTIPLFDEYVFEVPETEGIKYTGSKLRLLPFILDLIRETGSRIIFDGFSGSTRVSQALAKSGYQVISNDIALWSEVFGNCYLLNTNPMESYSSLIKELNDTPPKDGWFSQHYGGYENNSSTIQQDGLKRPW